MILYGIIAFGISLFLCGIAGVLGKRWNITQGDSHVSAIGGVAVIGAWWIGALMFGGLSHVSVAGFLIATVIIVILGVADVIRPLHPLLQLGGQISAAIAVIIGSGVTVHFVTHPFIKDRVVSLDMWDAWGIALPGTLFVLLWIVVLMNAVNFLDGMDGLSSGVSAIAFLAIGAVSLLPFVGDKPTALLAFLAAAVLIGFLFWNLPSAQVYLGTAGPWFIGFLLAVLSVQGASKVATAAVVGAVPLLDAATVIVGRLWRRQSPLYGDYTHLHHRLLRRGFSERTVLLIYYSVSLALGIFAVMLQTRFKVIVLLGISVLFVLCIIVGSYVVRRGKTKH